MLINDILGEDRCKTVLDPTLLVKRELWDSLSNLRLCHDKYIFVYLLRGTKKNRKLIEEYASRKHLKIVTIPFLDGENPVWYDFKFGDLKLWNASPQDFISAIRYSECVFTDSFHCMIFSCLYHRTFYIFQKLGNNQMSRLQGLHDLLGISRRIILSESSLEEIYNFLPIDWENTDMIINEKRRASREFLHNALICNG